MTDLESKRTELLSSIEQEKDLSEWEKSIYSRLINNSFDVLEKSKWKLNEYDYKELEKDVVALLLWINSTINIRHLRSQVSTEKIYKDYSEIAQVWEKVWVLKNTKIELSQLKRLRVLGINWDSNFTEKLIEWKSKWVNFKESVSVFEKKLWRLDVNRINSKELADYIIILVNEEKLNEIEITERLLFILWNWDLEKWAKKLKKLQKIWWWKWNTPSENILRKSWLWYIVDGVIKTNIKDVLKSYNVTKWLVSPENISDFKLLLNEQDVREKYLKEAWKQDIEENETPSLELLSYWLWVEIKSRKEIILNNLVLKYKLPKEKALEVYSKLENTNSAIEMVKMLKPFINVKSIKDLINLVLWVKEVENQKRKVEIEITKREAWKDEEKLQKIKEKEEKLEQQEFEIKKSKIISKHLDKKTIEIISKWTNEEEILLELKKQSNELKNELNKLEEYRELKEKWKTISDISLKNTTLNKNQNLELVSIDYEKDWVKTTIKIGELSPEEKQLTKTKEWLKSLVYFRQTLENLKLWSLWNYRLNIFKILRKHFINFNENDNYLNENEVRIFLIWILISLWKWTKEELLNKKLSQVSILINTENYKNKWVETNWNSMQWMHILEQEFYEKFVKWKDNWNDRFDWQEFDKSLKKES